MDKNKQPITKLAGLRTFAKDQESKNSKTTTTPTPIKVVETLEIKEQKKGTLSEHDFKIHHPKKEVVNIKENITATEIPKTVPVPPVVKKNDGKIDILVGNEDAGSATIITDTKKDRFKLFPAISESIKNWIDKIKADRQAKKAPKYTVPETTRRKGVIQKATSLTGKITSSDHDTIQERIRQRQSSEQEEKHDESVTWTPNTEPGYLLLEETTPRISNVQVQQRKSFFTTQQDIVVKNLASLKANKEITLPKNEPDSRWETSNLKTSEDVVIATPKPPQIVIETKPVTQIQEPVKIKTEVETPQIIIPEEKQPITDVVKDPIPVTQSIEPTIIRQEVASSINIDDAITEEGISKKTEPKNEHLNKSKGFLFSQKTNVLSFYVFALILIIIILIGVGYFWTKNTLNDDAQTQINTPVVINTNVSFVFQPITNKDEFISRITSELVNSESDVSQFVFTTSPNSKTPIKPSALLTYLGIILNANFGQSIDNLYFGQIEHTNTFITLNVTDIETARGGMFAWEQNMRNEIAPILKLTDLKSSTSTNNSKFIDAMISGVDVRVLKGSTGEDEIIYGFINANTIIITNNSSSFGRLVQLTK